MVDINIPVITEAINSLIGVLKYFVGILIAIVIVGLAVLLNYMFGLSVPSIVVDLLKFMFDSLKSLWLGIINTFHFDNKRQIFALSIMSFILLIFLLMAFSVNQMGTGSGSAGKISVGSGAVRESTEGEGSQQGSGGWQLQGTTPTTGTSITDTTISYIEYPAHCKNGIFEPSLGEEDINCGGQCIPCHCNDLEMTNNTNETGVDCGGDCPDACSCSPTGYNKQCGTYGYCCSTITCINMCVRPADICYGCSIPPLEEIIGLCQAGSCYEYYYGE